MDKKIYILICTIDNGEIMSVKPFSNFEDARVEMAKEQDAMLDKRGDVKSKLYGGEAYVNYGHGFKWKIAVIDYPQEK